jgi:restriction system protein
VDVYHDGLAKYQHIRGDDRDVVEQKAQAKMRQWDDMWARKQEAEAKRREREQRAAEVEEKKALAEEQTQEAETALQALDTLLPDALGSDPSVDWESLKNLSDYSAPRPAKPQFPEKPSSLQKPRKPSAAQFAPRLGILDRLFAARRDAREQEAQARFKAALEAYKSDYAEAVATYNSRAEDYNATVKQLSEEHKRSVAAWEGARQDYLRKRDQANVAIDKARQKYEEGDPDAIRDYCELVLSNSQYPDFFPSAYEIEYSPETKIAIVEYELLPIESMPTLKQVKYVQSRDEFDEKHISDAELRRRYDRVLYQVALRCIYELYEADSVDALASVVFNGYVDSVDKATGQRIHPCVLSVQAGKDEFAEINISAVEPKACFKKLKGVASAKLHTMTPVAPLLRMDRQDARFVDGRAVVDGVAEDSNLAAMDWQDCEHLIRELFEKEFAQGGGEVKVTGASRDGGVDAVVFDPDPIRGGTIVIQAKRYTHTVGVSAVRDLYGTLVNEGANKGVLVCTSDYGADAYNFAKGKPLVLLNGGELLHLLGKHGHRARIDLAEAKELLADDSTA